MKMSCTDPDLYHLCLIQESLMLSLLRLIHKMRPEGKLSHKHKKIKKASETTRNEAAASPVSCGIIWASLSPCISSNSIYTSLLYRGNSGYELSQWETLHCNVVSHWLSPYPEWSLLYHRYHIPCRLQLWYWLYRMTSLSAVPRKAVKFNCSLTQVMVFLERMISTPFPIHLQCRRKTCMVHQTFVWWASYITNKFVKSPIRHLGLAIGNVQCVRRFAPTLHLKELIILIQKFGAKPLSEPMLPYCQLDPKEYISVKFD